MARALRAFRDGDGSDQDWAGALMVAEAVEALTTITRMLGWLQKALGRRK